MPLLLAILGLYVAVSHIFTLLAAKLLKVSDMKNSSTSFVYEYPLCFRTGSKATFPNHKYYKQIETYRHFKETLILSLFRTRFIRFTGSLSEKNQVILVLLNC